MARQLRALGFDARALDGGFDAWRRAYDVEPTAPSAFVLMPSAQPAPAESPAPTRPRLASPWAEHPLWQRVRQAARALERPFTSRRDD